MSNEFIKKIGENAKNSASVEKQSNPKVPDESVARKNSIDLTASKKKEAVADSIAQPQPDTESQQGAGDEDFKHMLAQLEKKRFSYQSGETVTGKIVRVSEHGALVDFGYKSEGLMPREEFTSPDGNVIFKQGDDVEVVIRNMGRNGPPTLSYFDAKTRRSWNEIEEAFKNESIVKGKVTDRIKGGLKVDIKGVEVFLPGSQIDSRPVKNLDALKGKEIEAKVIKFNRRRNNIVISSKVVKDEIINKRRTDTLSKIDLGYVVEGRVRNLTDYGAFIDIGGIDGLLRLTDMSWDKLREPSDQFKVGDNVQVKVLKLDREKEKILLGFKQLTADPWSTVDEFYSVEDRVKGIVSRVTEYGAFVELEPGVEGLVHVSEMSWAKRMKHPKHIIKKGDEVEVQILGVDVVERRISLGIKQLQPNPWDTIDIRYGVGSKVEGEVRNLTDFGAFVEIEDGVDGLVHVSDISWSKKVKHPKDVLKKGQKVEAVVKKINVEGRRLSLSIKELIPSTWEIFTKKHKPGDVVKGKISRFAGFGIFVELAPDLEGLCHISELSEERVEKPEDLFEIGQELDFKILRIEHDVEKIGLSVRAVGEDDELGADSKSYSSEAKGSMASLGELANLKFGDKKAVPKNEKPEEIAKNKKVEGIAENNKKANDKSGEELETTTDDLAIDVKHGVHGEEKFEKSIEEKVRENPENKDHAASDEKNKRS